VATLERIVEIIATRKRVSFWWTMGVNQGHESTRTAQAIINLALMTGNIGRPGTGANSITGQCNAMGSRLFGNASSLLGGYDFAKAEHRAHVAGILGLDAAVIPSGKSWAYDQIIDGIDTGAIKGLWVIATNTAHSWINQKRFPELRAKLDFLVVQDMYGTTETAQMADLVLPAAGWGEKSPVPPASRWPTSRFSNSWPRPGAAASCSAAGNRPKRPSACCANSPVGNPASSPASRATTTFKTKAASSGRISPQRRKRQTPNPKPQNRPPPSAGSSPTVNSTRPTSARFSSSTNRAPCRS
jgi:hypothetical protein